MIGIDAAEFTSGNGPERVHVFEGYGGHELATGSLRSLDALWDKKESLMPFDVVLLSCEGQLDLDRELIEERARLRGDVQAARRDGV